MGCVNSTDKSLLILDRLSRLYGLDLPEGTVSIRDTPVPLIPVQLLVGDRQQSRTELLLHQDERIWSLKVRLYESPPLGVLVPPPSSTAVTFAGHVLADQATLAELDAEFISPAVQIRFQPEPDAEFIGMIWAEERVGCMLARLLEFHGLKPALGGAEWILRPTSGHPVLLNKSALAGELGPLLNDGAILQCQRKLDVQLVGAGCPGVSGPYVRIEDINGGAAYQHAAGRFVIRRSSRGFWLVVTQERKNVSHSCIYWHPSKNEEVPLGQWQCPGWVTKHLLEDLFLPSWGQAPCAKRLLNPTPFVGQTP